MVKQNLMKITNLAQKWIRYCFNNRYKNSRNLQKPIKNALDINKAKSANGIILNPNSGEILAIASLPDF